MSQLFFVEALFLPVTKIMANREPRRPLAAENCSPIDGEMHYVSPAAAIAQPDRTTRSGAVTRLGRWVRKGVR